MMAEERDETGSGNVFKDLGLPNSEEHLIKAQLVYKIDSILKERKLKRSSHLD
jgi:predicted XRE-type DNA-binding protein